MPALPDAPETFSLVARTPWGLEEVLAAELRALGAEDVQPRGRAVAFRGSRRLLYQANLCCRTAVRILRPIHGFAAANEPSLYAGVAEVDWGEHLEACGTLAVRAVVRDSFCTHAGYAAQLAKDAIVDQFRRRLGRRPTVERDQPDLAIELRLKDNQATVYVDSSGESLHKRGYRAAAGEAPLSEVLAAGILGLTGWQGSTPLADFMCGSATILIEAALVARRIAPGTLGRRYAFERWKDYERRLHMELLAELRDRELPRAGVPITGGDIDPAVVEIARHNARRAGVAGDVQLRVSSFDAFRPPAEAGTLVTNPPYDARLKAADIAAVYRRLGDVFKRRWHGYTAWVFTGNPQAARQVGLRTSRRIALFNGPIECRLLKYELYQSSLAGRTKEEAGPGGTDQPANSEAATGAAERPALRSWQDQAADLANRLRRMGRHWARWARRKGITCYRLYDRDIPEVPLTIDWFAGRLHVIEHRRPHGRTEPEHRAWLEHMVSAAAEVLKTAPGQAYVHPLETRRGPGAHLYRGTGRGKSAATMVEEAGNRYRIDLGVVETGLPLDERLLRALVQREATGRRFLDLSGGMGELAVAAAAGGAREVTVVNPLEERLEWARLNLRENGLAQGCCRLLCQPAGEYVRSLPAGEPRFDLVVYRVQERPRAARCPAADDECQLAADLLERLAAGGRLYLLSGPRRAGPDRLKHGGFKLVDITRRLVPPDIRRASFVCRVLVKAEPGSEPRGAD